MQTYHNEIENIFKTENGKIQNIRILHNIIRKIRIMWVHCTQFKHEWFLQINLYFVAQQSTD